jgi:hypothetical protein
MWPVAVSTPIAARHSSSVSATSLTNACRCAVSERITVPRRSSGDRPKLASTAAVMSSGVVCSVMPGPPEPLGAGQHAPRKMPFLPAKRSTWLATPASARDS